MNRNARWLGSLLFLLLSACGDERSSDSPLSISPPCERPVALDIVPGAEPGVGIGRALGVSHDQLPVGASRTYQVLASYCDGRVRTVQDTVVWSASHGGAQVSDTGVVTGLTVGPVHLIATALGLSASREVHVSDAMLQRLQLTPVHTQVPVDSTFRYRVEGEYDDGTTRDVTALATWTAHPPRVAQVLAPGHVAALGPGDASISASVAGVMASGVLAVTPSPAAPLGVSPASARLVVGQSQRFALHLGEGAPALTLPVAWSTDRPAVARIDNDGVLHALAPGVVSVRAHVGTHQVDAEVTVMAPLAGTLHVTPSVAELPVGATQPYQVTLTSPDGRTQAVSEAVNWTSSRPGVASVDAHGQVKADAPGEVQVCAALPGTAPDCAALLVTPHALRALQWVAEPADADGLLATERTRSWRVMGLYDEGWVRDVSATAAWRSSDPQVASVAPGGAVTGARPGEAAVMAQLDGVVVSRPLRITPLGGAVVWGGMGVDLTPPAAAQPGVRELAHTDHAFAALRGDGRVVTWGLPASGGDSDEVAPALVNVRSVVGNAAAFAALTADGGVVTWGSAAHGGDSAAVQRDLRDVERIVATGQAFAALRRDGRVVTWGHPLAGGDSDAVASRLIGVAQLFSTPRAFAALRADGGVVTWGDSTAGGDSAQVQAELVQVQTITPNRGAFAALRQDGKVVSWGAPGAGGASAPAVGNIKAIYAAHEAFAALTQDGRVVAWGAPSAGGNVGAAASQLTDVVSVLGNAGAFAALKEDGTVVTWGAYLSGGQANPLSGPLQGVKALYATYNAFAALTEDQRVVTWGGRSSGGVSSAVADQLVGVREVVSTVNAFAALRHDGRVVTWGRAASGGDSSDVSHALQHVQRLVATPFAFAALVTPSA
ncbi:Ig-like domain-containing protein [Aeromonas salmonicida]|uniref:Ig-like domain-containing protein n=1 Tax=Aeromonas salmonicida TaxID=645 RepID=UPI003D040519